MIEKEIMENLNLEINDLRNQRNEKTKIISSIKKEIKLLNRDIHKKTSIKYHLTNYNYRPRKRIEQNVITENAQ